VSATEKEIVAFMVEEFPQSQWVVEVVYDSGATIARDVGNAGLRSGGTVSGPALHGRR
jgi:hypothetical protein